MDAAPTNSMRATSNATRKTVLTWGLRVYRTPCWRAAPWRAGITAASSDTSRVFAVPLPRAVASISDCMGAAPINSMRATSNATRKTVLTWGLRVYHTPRRRAAPWRACITAVSSDTSRVFATPAIAMAVRTSQHVCGPMPACIDLPVYLCKLQA